ncbi:MAG: hypothetical protein HYY10_00215 [Candidatus Liptonbacteria bacterium]|nr:hypothetical protein [Candidatus Liptonbacteria bacterium]
MLKKNILWVAAVGVVAFVFGSGLKFMMAAEWKGPTAKPPGNNAEAPINVGSLTQTKSGGLTVGGKLTTNGTLDVAGGLITIRPWQFIVDTGSLRLGNIQTWAPNGTVIIGSVPSVAPPNGVRLNVNGKLQITDGTQSLNRVLASDAAGVARWEDVSNLVSGGGSSATLPDWVQSPSGPDKVPVADQNGNVSWQIVQQGGGGAAGVSKIIAGIGIAVDPVGGTGEVKVSATGGGSGNASAASFKGAWCGYGSRYGNPATGEKNKSGTGGIGFGYQNCGDDDPAESCPAGFSRAEFRDTANTGEIHYYYTCINTSGAAPSVSGGNIINSGAPVIKMGVSQISSWTADCSPRNECSYRGSFPVNFKGKPFSGTPGVTVVAETESYMPVSINVTNVSSKGFTVVARGPVGGGGTVQPLNLTNNTFTFRWLAVSEEK